MKPIIDPEFRDMIPPSSEKELLALRSDMRHIAVRDRTGAQGNPVGPVQNQSGVQSPPWTKRLLTQHRDSS